MTDEEVLLQRFPSELVQVTPNFGDCTLRRARFFNVVGDDFLWSRRVLYALRSFKNEQSR